MKFAVRKLKIRSKRQEKKNKEGKGSNKSYELVQLITNNPSFHKILYLIGDKQLTSTLVIKSFTLA